MTRDEAARKLAEAVREMVRSASYAPTLNDDGEENEGCATVDTDDLLAVEAALSAYDLADVLAETAGVKS